MRNGKAFPHRVSAMIGNEQYEHLKKESEAHGYQIALNRTVDADPTER